MHSIFSSNESSLSIKVSISSSMALGAYPWELKDELDRLAQCIAKEGIALDSPLIRLILGYAGKYGERLNKQLECAYYFYRDDIKTIDYFDVQDDGAYLKITSKEIRGGHGSVRLFKAHTNDFLSRLRFADIETYQIWGENQYPVGGATALLRLDNYYSSSGIEVTFANNEEGLLRVDPDTHPSNGWICFGDKSQELIQLSALAKLKVNAKGINSTNIREPSALIDACRRAIEINARTNVSFMPSDGFCSWCNEDTTTILIDAKPNVALTGCPVCGHSWCD